MIEASITKEQCEKSLPGLKVGIDRHLKAEGKKLPFFGRFCSRMVDGYADYLACYCYESEQVSSFYAARRLQQFYLGLYQSSLHHGEAMAFELDDQTHTVYGDARSANTTPYNYSFALITSWITRNSTAQDYLVGCDLDQVIEANRTFDTVVSDFSRLYRALHLQQDVSDDLLMAINSPSTLEGGNVWEEVVRDLYIPQLDVVAAIAFAEGEQRFNQAIENSLLKHQHHYNTYPDSAVTKTAISVPLMGLAALAFDRLGYRVTVENRYIPQWLVEHQDWSQLPPLADDSLRLNFPVRTRNPLEK